VGAWTRKDTHAERESEQNHGNLKRRMDSIGQSDPKSTHIHARPEREKERRGVREKNKQKRKEQNGEMTFRSLKGEEEKRGEVK